jgi:hypothetical protein
MANQDLETAWRSLLAGEKIAALRTSRRIFRRIPAERRCKNCSAPFTGAGGVLMRLHGRRPYKRNPRFCNF